MIRTYLFPVWSSLCRLVIQFSDEFLYVCSLFVTWGPYTPDIFFTNTIHGPNLSSGVLKIKWQFVNLKKTLNFSSCLFWSQQTAMWNLITTKSHVQKVNTTFIRAENSSSLKYFNSSYWSILFANISTPSLKSRMFCTGKFSVINS